jgi:hypothetical protein
MRHFFGLVLLVCACAAPAWSQVRNPDGDLRQDRDETLPGREQQEVRRNLPPSNEPEDVPFWSWRRMLVGGSLGASFGSVIFVEVSPTVAYHITPMLRLGGGMTYRYVNDTRNFFPFQAYKANVWGGRAFVQHDLFYGVFLHGEYEYLRANYLSEGTSPEEYRFPSVLVGGGYAMPLGGRASGQGGPALTNKSLTNRSMLQLQVLHPITLNPGNSLYFYPVELRMSILVNI